MTDIATSELLADARKALERIHEARTEQDRAVAVNQAWTLRGRALDQYQQIKGVVVSITPGPPTRRDGAPDDLMQWAGSADRALAEQNQISR